MSELMRILAPKMGEPVDVRALYYQQERSNDRLIPQDRTSFVIEKGSEISFEAYFNAFPAAYWKKWTDLRQVILRISYTGEARVDIYRSKSNGARIAVAGRMLQSNTPTEYAYEVDLGPFEDGGFLWFDVVAQSNIHIHQASWFAPEDEPQPRDGNVSIGFPTFNRPDFATETLIALGSDPQLVKHIDSILVVDQGTQKLVAFPSFAAVAQQWGDVLAIVEQANYGGSGGYARILYEALLAQQSEFILFMDDDVVIEPECLLRAIMLARYTTQPTIIGAQMLNLQERSHLHTLGEKIDPGSFMWTAASTIDYDFDLGSHSYRNPVESTGLHRRVDVEFNGWWTCLIPREIPEKIGLALPLFLKWDDAEFGLRAARAGYATATIPGIAVWHMAWTDKDDAIDWQAYFHLRNRLIVAALYYEGKLRGIYLNLMKALLKHLLCLEYSTVVIQMRAIADFLSGPDNLFPLLGTALEEVNQIRAGYSDAVLITSAKDLPRSSEQVSALGKIEPHGIVAKLFILFKAIRVNLRKENPEHHRVPQANFTPLEARWYSLGRSDGVTVTAADARGVFYRVRKRRLMFQLLIESTMAHLNLMRKFEQKKRDYRQAHHALVSMQSWEQKFHER